MKRISSRKLRCIPAALLALLIASAALLCGCRSIGLPLITLNNTEAPATDAPYAKGGFPLTQFDKMPYRRPDMDAIERLFAETTALAENAQTKDGQELKEKLLTCWDAYDEFYTMETIAMLRSDMDLTDEFYAGEYDFYLDNEADVEEWLDRALTACACCEAYVPASLLAGYTAENSEPYSDRMIELMERENSLLSDYRDAMQLDEIEIGGRKQSFTEYVSDPLISDEEYREAKLAYYRACNEAAAPIYIELIKVRRAMADEIGIGSYEDYQYYVFGRDYSPDQVRSYLDGIAEDVADRYIELTAGDPYSRVQYASLSERELMEQLQTATSKMGQTIADSFRYMKKYHLYDAECSSSKSESSYTVYLRSYDTPFCFLGAHGDVEDYLDMAHEFGHFVDARANYNATFSLDLSETYSQGMANLVLLKSMEFLSRESYDNLLLLHLLSNMSIFAEQTAYADFESRVYALDDGDLTVENLNAIAKECARRFGASASEAEDEEYAVYWTQVGHLFEQPFYVISYCISADAAIQIAEKELNEPGAGVKCYEKLLDWDEGYFLKELERAGLVSPFAPGRAAHNLELVSSIAADELDELLPAA